MSRPVSLRQFSREIGAKVAGAGVTEPSIHLTPWNFIGMSVGRCGRRVQIWLKTYVEPVLKDVRKGGLIESALILDDFVSQKNAAQPIRVVYVFA